MNKKILFAVAKTTGKAHKNLTSNYELGKSLDTSCLLNKK